MDMEEFLNQRDATVGKVATTSASTGTSEIKSVKSQMFSMSILPVLFWVVIICAIVYAGKKRRGGIDLSSIEKPSIDEKLSREEQFEELSKIVSGIIKDGYTRNQGNLCKRVARILQIKSCVLTYKSLSAVKKVEARDLLKSSKPFELINFHKIEPDGTVHFMATANPMLSMDNMHRLNRLNTGDDYGTMEGTTVSELIKDNPDINVNELAKTIESRC